ncbi:MAG: glycerophosphodiester phosphodiesterase family protein [Pseudomonadota bacterium]
MPHPCPWGLPSKSREFLSWSDPMLPPVFLVVPFAHRGLHDLAAGRPENSRAAIAAAIDHGYGIEIDLQLTSDNVGVVFHDYTLERLTDGVGRVRTRTQGDLATLKLKGGTETVPSFAEVLALVAGRVPLLVELKDQDGALGDNVGTLEADVAKQIAEYEGPLAVMSFNPHSVSAMQALAPHIPRGLVTDSFTGSYWDAPPERLAELAKISDFDRVGASFVSHEWQTLRSQPIKDLKVRGVPIFCWTIRSPSDEADAREVADNVTFEGYLPKFRA